MSQIRRRRVAERIVADFVGSGYCLNGLAHEDPVSERAKL